MTYVGKSPADIIATAVDTTTGTFSGDLTVDTNTLYVDSANNRVGVGTVSPAEKVDIAGNDANAVSLQIVNSETASASVLLGQAGSSGYGVTSWGSSVGILDGTNGLAIGSADPSAPLLFYTSNTRTERMRIDSSGNVGIGTTSPNFTLDVASEIGISEGNALAWHDGSGGRAFDMFASGADNSLRFRVTGSSEVMRITSGGNVGINTTSPYGILHISGDPTERNSAYPGLVLTNDADSYSTSPEIGIHFSAIYTGTSVTDLAHISGGKENGSSGNYAGVLKFYTRTNGSANVTERVRIDSSGNVGIGTNNPGTALSFDAGTNTILGLNFNASSGNGGSLQIRAGGGNGSGNSGGNLNLCSGTGTNSASVGNIIFGRSSGDNTTIAPDAEWMRIDSSGNVGIGGTSFNPKLYVVNNSAGPFLTAANATAVFHGSSDIGKGGCIGFDYGASHTNYPVGIGYAIESQSGNTKGSLVFGTRQVTTDTAPPERMRINSEGNLLVGTTDDRGRITVHRNTNAAATPTVYFSNDGSSGVFASFGDTSGTVIGTITRSGSSTSYNTSSDHRLKENVVEMTDATTRLKQLQPKRFNFIADADTTVDGFLAHEVQSVVPEAITGTHNEVDDDGNPVYQGIDQSKLVPLLVKTIQELEARIEALENA